jgi:hypothetical protein
MWRLLGRVSGARSTCSGQAGWWVCVSGELTRGPGVGGAMAAVLAVMVFRAVGLVVVGALVVEGVLWGRGRRCVCHLIVRAVLGLIA